MKLYCPGCGQEIDETEFLECEEFCAICYKSEQNLIQKNKRIKKENILP